MREGADHFMVVSTGSLPQEHARYPLSPELLDRCQDAQLVVCKNALPSRIASLDIIKDLYQRPFHLIWISTRPFTASDRPAFSTLHGWNAPSPFQAADQKPVPKPDPRDQARGFRINVLSTG